MIDFTNIDYLKVGNPKQRAAFEALTKYAVLEKLRRFTPVLTGTIPIEIDIENSDLDVCCCYGDKTAFINMVHNSFQHFKCFKLLETIINEEETILANFFIDDFEIEVFGQKKPVKKQNSYRHMLIEHQILQAKGKSFRQQVINLKKKGIKTEPAFAQLLGLEGNPYQSILNY